jgi:hypothetical protein
VHTCVDCIKSQKREHLFDVALGEDCRLNFVELLDMPGTTTLNAGIVKRWF